MNNQKSRIISTPRLLIVATLLSTSFSAYGADILYSEDFNSPNSATPLGSFNWSQFQGGSPNSPTTVSSGTTSGGVFNTERVAHINLNTTNATSSWFGGLSYDYASALSETDLSKISITANIYGGGSVGARGDAVLRIESSTGNWLGFIADTNINNGSIVGGLLSDATTSSGTFDATASSFRITVAFANTVSTWGNDSSNILGVDNVVLSTIPEPSTHLLVGTVGLFVALSTCRRKALKQRTA
jgi:hypothetical protein